MAHIFRQYAQAFLDRYAASSQQRRVIRDIQFCRTAALGGHIEQCDRCGHQQVSYNSCRNRHCPKCQGPARARWLEARAGELLPVPYFHVVFTLPALLAPLALQNPATVYGLLFEAVAATLLEVAANPRRMGARLGFLAILHTWGQNLMHHPHLHCVVPAGGLSTDGARWIRGNARFFLPVRVLSRVFRGKFLHLLKVALREGRLKFYGQLKELASPAAMRRLLDRSVRNDWVVYAKPPFGGPTQVLKYLARYTHRVAISNSRLLRLEHDQVTFRWKDYAHGNKPAVMTLDAVEFIRRFLLHVLPRNFVRIRYYGFMANRNRSANLAHCRQLLGQPATPQADEPQPSECPDLPVSSEKIRCPVCEQGYLRIIRKLPRQTKLGPAAIAILLTGPITYPDTS